jgi:protein SCO1/2
VSLAVVRAAAAAIAVVLLASCGGAGGSSSSSPFQGTELTAGAARPSFTLTDTEGRPYDFAAETAGSTTLLFFGYTSCPDICPVHLATIAAALRTDEAILPDATVVMVTVDPDRDTPQVLREYLDKFDPSFVGLTGTKAEVEAAQRAAGLTVAVPEADDEGNLTGIVGHSAQVIGIGADDVQHVAWPFGTRSSVYAHDLEELGRLESGIGTP